MNARHRLALLALLALAGCKEGPQGPRGLLGGQGPLGDQGDPGQDNTVPGEDGEPNLIITGDTTWSGLQEIGGMVYVEAGATLTIEAGTFVDFLPGGSLFVDGVLIAQGTALDPVTFAPSTPFDDAVGAVWIAGETDATLLEHVRFERLDLRLVGSVTDTIDGIEMVDGNLEVRGDTTGLVINACDLSDTGAASGTRVWVTDSPSLTLSACVITGGEVGVHLESLGSDVHFGLSNTDLARQTRTAVKLRGDASLHAVTFDLDGVSVDGSGMVGNSGDPAVDLLDADGTVAWLEVQGSTGTCLSLGRGSSSSVGTVTVQDSSFTDCARGGIAGGYSLTLEAVDISGSERDGAFAKFLIATDTTVSDVSAGLSAGTACTLSGVTVTDARANGIFCPSSIANASTISDCVVTNSGGQGISGGYSTNIQGCNITGSGGFGVSTAAVVDGNYIADNNGQVGADLSAGGTLGGPADVDTSQVRWVDVLSNPQSSPVVGAGAR